MRKASTIAIIVIFTSVLTPAGSSGASPKSGTTCSKAGALSSSSGVKYTCVKQGKKLVWKIANASMSGVPSTPTSTQTATPSQSATPTVIKTLIPITLPVAQSGKITFANISSHISDIPQTAWDNVQSAIAANPESNIPITIYVGPNTDTTPEIITSAIRRELKLFNGFSLPPTFTAIVYSAADEVWAEAQWIKIGSQPGYKDDPKNLLSRIRDNCQFSNGAAVECYAGFVTTIRGTDNGYAFYGVQKGNYWSASSTNSGPMSQVNHEFTHVLQFAQFNGVPIHAGDNTVSDTVHRVEPCWFQEGHANAIGIPVQATKYADYLDVRDQNIRRGINGQSSTLANYSSSAITDFIYNQVPATGPNTPGCYQPGNGDYSLGYSLGYAATEVLVAIGGPQSTMAVLAKASTGLNWAQSFEAVYGLSWKEGAKIIGEVLAAEYAAKPMNS